MSNDSQVKYLPEEVRQLAFLIPHTPPSLHADVDSLPGCLYFIKKELLGKAGERSCPKTSNHVPTISVMLQWWWFTKYGQATTKELIAINYILLQSCNSDT
jgi:hypothetical protein